MESGWNAVLQTLEGHSDPVNSVAFSHDSKLLASASSDNTVKVWDAATGLLQQTVKVNGYVSSLSFDNTDSCLITNIGRIKVNKTRLAALSDSSQEGRGKSNREGLGISGPWVTWNAENLLWLPPGYRGQSGISLLYSKVAIGCPSGMVFIIGFLLILREP